MAQWIECGLRTKGSPVQFPVRAHAWVVGQVPSGGHVRSNHTLMYLSLPCPLSKNKYIKSLKKLRERQREREILERKRERENMYFKDLSGKCSKC